MHTFHLTAAERRLFDTLSGDLKEGWTAEEEAGYFADDEHRRRIRFETLRVQHPESEKFLKALLGAGSLEEVQKTIEKSDFSDVPGSDIAELLFAIGPDGITLLLHKALKTIANDEDMAYAAQLSEARHELLASLQNFAS